MSWVTADFVKYPARDLHLGHQKLSRDEIDRLVDRLSSVKVKSNLDSKESGGLKKPRKLHPHDVEDLVQRLSKETRTREKDKDVKNENTIVTSYAWCNGRLLHFHPKPLDGTWHWCISHIWLQWWTEHQVYLDSTAKNYHFNVWTSSYFETGFEIRT